MEEDVFTYRHDIFSVPERAAKFLTHICNDACIVKNADGTFFCRKIDNVKASPDNTKHTYVDLPNDYSVVCLWILEAFGMTTALDMSIDLLLNMSLVHCILVTMLCKQVRMTSFLAVN